MSSMILDEMGIRWGDKEPSVIGLGLDRDAFDSSLSTEKELDEAVDCWGGLDGRGLIRSPDPGLAPPLDPLLFM